MCFAALRVLRIRKRQEPVSVQTFGAELAVKALDERIVGWFAGTREVQRDTLGIGPQVQIVGDELRLLDSRSVSKPVPKPL
jgi:hypothetical protein